MYIYIYCMFSIYIKCLPIIAHEDGAPGPASEHEKGTAMLCLLFSHFTGAHLPHNTSLTFAVC